MKNSILFLSILFFSTAYSQQFCPKTSVYFDLNKAGLKPVELQHIDELMAKANGQTVLAELYGFSDSTASANYNLQLSQKRTVAVKTYIQQHYPNVVRFTEKNLGEETAGSNDPAYDRRVDLFLVPVSGDQIVLDNGREMLELPMDYFEPCGVCSSRPKIDGIYTDAQAEAAGMRFETNDGDALITAGTVNFNFEPCDPGKKNPKTYCINVRAASLDREMTFWEPDTIKGIIYWKESALKPEFDTRTNTYRVCGVTGRGGNLDKRRRASGIVFPFKHIKSTFYTPDMKRINVTLWDSIPYDWKDTIKTVVSMGKSGEKIFFLKENLLTMTERIDTTKPYNICQVFRVPSDYYQEFLWSDTLMKVRFSRKTKVKEFGFYLPEMNEFVPLKYTKNRRNFVIQKPLTPCIPAIMKGKSLYVCENESAIITYKKSQQAYRGRITKKKMKAFQREKAWIL